MICWSFHCHRLSMNHFRSAPVPQMYFFGANFYCLAVFFIDLSDVSAPHWLLKSHYYFRSSAHCLSLKKHHHFFLYSVNCLFPIDFSAPFFLLLHIYFHGNSQNYACITTLLRVLALHYFMAPIHYFTLQKANTNRVWHGFN